MNKLQAASHFLTLLILPLIILGTNLALIWPLFGGGYTQQMGSIESVFIADAKFIFENFPNLSWHPYWYTGFPFHLFYTPLLPALMALSHWLYQSIDIASWYRIYIGLFYAGTAVSFYFLVRYLVGKSSVGFLAAAIFSFLPTFTLLISQVGWGGPEYQLVPWRLLTLIIYGEGGHIAGLFFIPLALLFSLKAVREASFINVLLASILTALVALTNIIALIALAVMLAIAWITELFAGGLVEKLRNGIIVAVFSFGLSAFWYNLSFARASLSIGTGGVSGNFTDTYIRFLPLLFLLAPVLFVLVMLGKRQSLRLIFLSGCWVAIFYAAAHFWFNGQTMILPQPNRYLPEMEMGAALLIAYSIYLLVKKLLANRFNLLIDGGLTLAALALLLTPLNYLQPVWRLLSPHPEISQTAEYKVAFWLKDNTSGERVYATGSTAFWLNTFTNVPQIRGGNDGVTNPRILDAVYQVNTGENTPKDMGGEIALNWLRALNVSYLVVNLPQSREVFHDFLKLERFSDNPGFKELVNLSGDVIYQVSLSQPSLAQVVEVADLTKLRPLKNGVDGENLQKYVDYIDNPAARQAQFTWTKPGKAEIVASLREGQGIALQIPFDPGWKATINGQSVPIKKDILNFMLLEPPVVETGRINLEYRPTGDVWLGFLLTILTTGGLVYYSRLKINPRKLHPSFKLKDEEEE